MALQAAQDSRKEKAWDSLGTPRNPGNYLHDMEKHWSKPFKLEEQGTSREI